MQAKPCYQESMHTHHSRKASDLIVPIPKSIEDWEGTFRLHPRIAIAAEKGFEAVHQLALELFGCKAGGEDILFKYQAGMEQEAYILTISKVQIVIKAGTDEGAFRGLSTIRKLALLTDNQLPCCKVEDSPTFAWRGYMVDCSRHQFSIAFLKKLIDVASLFHLNRFHWHLTDDQGWRIPLDGWPKLESIASKRTELQYTDGRTYGRLYSKEEILDLQAYAHARHVLVVPEIETPGHASALLAAYPEFGCTGGPYETQDRWGIFEEVMCAGSDELIGFLGDAITQIAELFSSPYIHIGGDECPHAAWQQCPRCQERMRQLGLTDARYLQSWMTSKVCEMVHNAGKQPIGWDEVLEGTEQLGLPKDLIVMSWRGVQGGLEATRRGHQVIMCPNTAGCYFDYKHLDSEEEMGTLGVSTLNQVAHFSCVPDSLQAQAKAYVLGSQGNLWTEKVTTSRQAEYLLFPRLMMLAQQLWKPEDAGKVLQSKSTLTQLCDALDLTCYRGE